MHQHFSERNIGQSVAKTKEEASRSGHLAKGLPMLLLFGHVLGHPLLVATQLVVAFDLQKLHLLFAPVSFPLQPHELQDKENTG